MEKLMIDCPDLRSAGRLRQMVSCIAVPMLSFILSGCFWITSPFNGPTVNYPTSSVEAFAWSPDGSKCVSIERHEQNATSGSSYALVTYGSDGRQIASIALTGDVYAARTIFVDPANANVFYSDGSEVEEVSLASGATSTLVYSYRAIGQSASGKYIILTNESAQDPHSFELLDISGARPRPVHQWAVSLASNSPSLAWSGDSVFGYLGYTQSSALSLFVVDTNIHRHDSLNTTNDFDALYSSILAGGGSFYLSSMLGVTRLAPGSAGTWVVQDSAAVASISQDGRVIAYCTNPYGASTLHLLNPATGKVSTISSRAINPAFSPSGDRIAYIESPDYDHATIHIVPVQIP